MYSRVNIDKMEQDLTFFIYLKATARDLASNFITGCPNWDFKNLESPKSLFEKVKIITLILYIYLTNKVSICLIP